MNSKGFFSDFGKEDSYSLLMSSNCFSSVASLNISVPSRLSVYRHRYPFYSVPGTASNEFFLKKGRPHPPRRRRARYLDKLKFRRCIPCVLSFCAAIQ